ncbi:MAG: UbiA family prenyltransferase, partial [Myxococcota bacterium]
MKPSIEALVTAPQVNTAGADAVPSTEASADRRPLCVDLDGTLIATDMLWESFLLLLKSKPWLLLVVPVWFSQGKAKMKRRLVELVQPDPAALPYRPEVLAYITAAKDAGRPAHLVTASDQRLADRVQQHLQIFDEAIGSDGTTNLKGANKAALLESRFGRGAYDYVGDSSADAAPWEAAHTAIAVDPRSGIAQKARRANPRVEVITPKMQSTPKAMMKALRPHQWLKNVLLFVAPILAHRTELALWLQVLLGFVAFSLTASSVYILNDLLDLESDRQHRTKRHRPFAAGALSIPAGLALFPVVLLGGLVTSAVFLPWMFTAALIGYWALTTAYSFYLKRKMMVDVLTLAALFTYRVLSGGLAARRPSSWHRHAGRS